jgi:hypothetical protein
MVDIDIDATSENLFKGDRKGLWTGGSFFSFGAVK